MRVFRSFVAAFIGGLASVSFAGWDSGGGFHKSDRPNPWFLHNTESIKYCISIDQSNISIDQFTANNAVVASWKYWQKAFAFNNTFEEIRFATQRIQKVPCSSNPDVFFQFGSLESFSNHIPNPQKIIAYTGRTSYDKVKLKGKGFVYVAGDLDIDGKIRYRRWERVPEAFTGVLIHEWAHVLGVRHNDDHGFTGEHTPMFIATYDTSDENLTQILGSRIAVPFLPGVAPAATGSYDFRRLNVAEIFGASVGDFLHVKTYQRGKIAFYVSDKEEIDNSRWNDLGYCYKNSGQSSSLIQMLITPEADVFRDVEKDPYGLTRGALSLSIVQRYCSTDSLDTSSSLVFIFDSQGFYQKLQILGNRNNRIEPILRMYLKPHL